MKTCINCYSIIYFEKGKFRSNEENKNYFIYKIIYKVLIFSCRKLRRMSIYTDKNYDRIPKIFDRNVISVDFFGF